MRLPRGLNGDDVVRHLTKHWGYRIETQRGSHVILVTDAPRPHRPPVPNHKPIGTGLLRAIVNQVCEVKLVDKDDVLRGL